MKRLLGGGLLLLVLTSCAWWNKDPDSNSAFKGMTAKELYTEAKKLLAADQYNSAATRFEALESMYPFSPYAESSQRLLIYAYYQNAAYPAAAAEAEHYIHLYPRSAHVDYAYYMKGLANFQQPRGALLQLFPIEESWRDPGTQLQAYTDFLTFTQKFPKSAYYNNALQRLIYLRNEFSNRELHNAEFAFDRHMYVAAIARATYLIQTYPESPAVKPALKLMYRAQLALRLYKAAQETATVYQATYHQAI